MLTISSSSARENLLSLFAAGASKTNRRSLSQSAETVTNLANPAAIIDLSDEAKAVLKRNKADQVVADRLQQQLAANSKTNDASGRKRASKLLETAPATLPQDGLKFLDLKAIEAEERRLLNGEQLQLGNEYMSPDEAFVDGFMRSIVNTMLRLEDAGKTTEASQLRSAIQGGTVKVQRASEVNIKYTNEKIAGGERGGIDWSGASEEAKALINNNRAFTHATPNEGAFFITW